MAIETNETREKSLNFLEEIIETDIAKGNTRVQTRFPPEPNGYLHIGHAKSICINFGLAQKYGGKCNLRFDDTNPVKEDVEYVDSIKRDIRWLGFEWAQERYASDYFDQLYERSPETAAERNARRRAQFKASVRPAQKVSFLALLGFACVSLLMVSLLLCYVRLNDISRSIVSMKSEIKQLEVEQVSLLTQHEKVFDLSAVKEAAEAAGMVQPSESQIYNIELPGANQAVSHSGRRSAGSAESLLDRVLDKLRGLLE